MNRRALDARFDIFEQLRPLLVLHFDDIALYIII